MMVVDEMKKIAGLLISVRKFIAPFVLFIFICNTVNAADDDKWIATWAVSAMPPSEILEKKITPLENFTIRQVVRSTIGGNRVRLRLSNVFGASPLQIAGVSVALLNEGSSVVADTLTTATFSGSSHALIPAGEFIYSDPVSLPVEEFSGIAVSMYFQEAVSEITRHGSGPQMTYISVPGDYTGAENIPVFFERRNAMILTGIEVENDNSRLLIVCFGDSITDSIDAPINMSWPDFLARRLAGKAGVINQGVKGNRLLHDFVGQSGISRFSRDVSSWESTSHVIVLLGINDLGYSEFDSNVFPDNVEAPVVSAEEMIAGYRQLIAQARDKDIKIIGATLTPYKGSYFSEAGEAVRIKINQWIREGGEFDAVIDFDAAIRNVTQQDRIDDRFHDENDWLHPNTEGLKAMADSIDLSIFE